MKAAVHVDKHFIQRGHINTSILLCSVEPESIRLRTVSNRGVARIFLWGGPKNRFQNFGKYNLGEYPLPSGMCHRGGEGGGYFSKLPKRVCAAQQGRDFRILSFTAKLGPWSQPGDKNVQNVLFRLPIATSRFHADSRKKCTRLLKTAFY